MRSMIQHFSVPFPRKLLSHFQHYHSSNTYQQVKYQH
uniref:Uncharacterized protein n=1 Tax=Rhizophora mucronata TaxID=61149 RepID=A0A2P2QME7_RHIMU